MLPNNYKNFWNDKATSYTGALIAVDGSADENAVVATGARSSRQVAAAINASSASRVLEIGCGVARIGVPLLEKVGFWHGTDISENMLGVAKGRLEQAGYGADRFDLTPLARPKLPFADASFDAVYSIAVFIHMDKEDFFLYLREAARVLKPGGRLFFDHWNLAHPVGLKRFLYEANYFDKAGDPAVRKDVARNQFTTPQEVKAYLDHIGLQITALIDDGCWVQALAFKGEGDALISEKARVVAGYDQIAYGKTWTQYFDWVLPVVFEGMHPRVILQRLQAEPSGEVREMYETWLKAAWKNNPSAYGEYAN
jgi:SAM-dependent methyltransferase